MKTKHNTLSALSIIAALSILMQFCSLIPTAQCIKSTDLNLDGITDIEDIVVAAEAFGTSPGHERWNVDADIDEDNKVGIADIISIALEFGQTSL